MSNFIFIYDSGKHFKLGSWILKDQQWSYDNKYSKFVGLIGGSYNSIFVNELEHSNVNTYFKVPIETMDHLPCHENSVLTDHESNLLGLVIDKLMVANIIRKSVSPYASPAKPQYMRGNLDLVVDYTYLNTFTFDRAYALPNVNAFVYSMSKSNLFSKIVLKQAFYQIALVEEAKHKTAFMHKYQTYEFNTLQSGLKNAHQYLQELMESVLKTMDQSAIKVYLGYILIHTENFDHHLRMLKNLFSAFSQANLKIDIDESSFLMTDEVYLGYRVSSNGVSISQDNLDKIRDLPIPMNLQDIRLFLDLVEPFKVFSPDFNTIVAPLERLTIAGVLFRWTWIEQKSLDDVKRSLMFSSPVPYRNAKTF